MLQQLLYGPISHAWNLVQLGSERRRVAPRSVEGYREPVRFIADGLDKVQDGRIAVERDGFVLLAADVDQLFPLGDGG